MDTSSCVMGVVRFVSRRGTLAMFDRTIALNLFERRKSAEKLPKSGTLSIVNIAAELAHKGINWWFNPTSAPHQGVIWERFVRSFKRVLYTILGTCRLTAEVMHNTFCLVEHALNWSPLTPVSADQCNLNVITPNHFLLGEYRYSVYCREL